MERIFVSYSRVDRYITEQLVAHLRRIYGHKHVWFDENLRAGQTWWDEVRRQIDKSDVFIILISPESLNSKYCMMELNAARDSRKHIIPVLVRDRTVVPPNIKNLHMIKMPGSINLEALTDLQAAIYHARADTTDAGRQDHPPPNATRPALSSRVVTRPAQGTDHSVPAATSPPATSSGRISAGISAAVGVLLLMVGVGGWLLTGDVIPSTEPTPTPTGQSANDTNISLSATARPDGLTLTYNRDVLTLINKTSHPLDASHLTFARTDDTSIRFDSNMWRDGTPLGTLRPDECVQLWTNQSRRVRVPSDCEERLRWRQVSPLRWFWREGTFVVKQGSQTLATCTVSDGTCHLPAETRP